MKIEQWKITDVIPYEKNVKNHDETQVRKIAKSIEEFGWDQPIVVDGFGVIIKGHGRALAADYLGLKTVPVVVRTDLSPEAVKAARIADNRVAESSINTSMLQDELREIDFDFHGIFDDKELDFMVADLGAMNDSIFVDDLDAEVNAQSRETESRIEEVDSREIPIAKALGFKFIPGKDEKHLVRFIAMLEEQFKTDPATALVNFAKGMVADYKPS